MTPGMWQWCCCGGIGNSVYIAWVDNAGDVILGERQSGGLWRYETISSISVPVALSWVKVILAGSIPVVFYTDGTLTKNLYMVYRNGDYGSGYSSPKLIGTSTAYSVVFNSYDNNIYILWYDSNNNNMYLGEISGFTTYRQLYTATARDIYGPQLAVKNDNIYFLHNTSPRQYAVGYDTSYTVYDVSTQSPLGLNLCQGDVVSTGTSPSGTIAGTMGSAGIAAETSALLNYSPFAYEKSVRLDNGNYILLLINTAGTYMYLYEYDASNNSWTAINSFSIVGGDYHIYDYDVLSRISYIANIRSSTMTLYIVNAAGDVTTEYPASPPNYYGNSSMFSIASLCVAGSQTPYSA